VSTCQRIIDLPTIEEAREKAQLLSLALFGACEVARTSEPVAGWDVELGPLHDLSLDLLNILRKLEKAVA